MLPALGCRIDSPEVPPQEQRTAAVRSRTQAGTAQQRSPPALPADKGTQSAEFQLSIARKTRER